MEDNRIKWTNCEDCGAQLYLKSLKGRRPKFCDACRKKRQDPYRKEK